jgi:hypothetical protein
LSGVEGERTVTRSVKVYSFKGLLEICRYSNQPKANAVMDLVKLRGGFEMHLSEAERRARSNLYNLETNAAMFEHKEDLAKIIRERGSRTEQRYDEKPGKVSARYVESIPSWLLEIENVERAVWELFDAVTMTRGMLKFYQAREPECYRFYGAKYRDELPIPELKRLFGADMKKLDRDVVYNLIRWHDWPIDEDGSGEYRRWLEKRERW